MCSWNLWCNVVALSRDNVVPASVHSLSSTMLTIHVRHHLVCMCMRERVPFSQFYRFTKIHNTIKMVHRISSANLVYSKRHFQSILAWKFNKIKTLFYTLLYVNAILFRRAHSAIGVLRKIDSWRMMIICQLIYFPFLCVFFFPLFRSYLCIYVLFSTVCHVGNTHHFAMTASQMRQLPFDN